MDWMSNEYIKSADLATIFEMAKPFLEEAGRLTDKAEKLVELYKPQMKSVDEIVPLTDLFFSDFPELTEAEKEAEKRREQWPWNPDAEAPKDPETERMNQVAEKIRTYIRENYMNEISMQDAARQFNYSDAYFCKLFKQCFDQNFTTYLTNFRINEAKRLLKDRNISVKDAGMKVDIMTPTILPKSLSV